MARAVRKTRVKKVPLSEVKDELSRYLRETETHEVVITRHGKPAGVLIGFQSEEAWFEYCLEHDPHFLRRIGQARKRVCAKAEASGSTSSLEIGTSSLIRFGRRSDQDSLRHRQFMSDRGRVRILCGAAFDSLPGLATPSGHASYRDFVGEVA